MLDEKGKKNMNVPGSAKEKRWEGISPVSLKKNLGLSIWFWDYFCSLLKEIFQSQRWKGGPTFLGDQDTKFFILLFSLYPMGEENTFFSDTSKYSQLCLVQQALWLSSSIYLTHTQHCKNINAQLIIEIKCVTWVKDPCTVRFVCQNTIFINRQPCMVRWLSQEYIHCFCCPYWECWSHMHLSIMFLKRNPQNRKWETLIKKLLTQIICTL